MVNYQNGKIYTLKSPNCEKYYIGSTTQLLCKRKQKHITDSNKINCRFPTSKIIVDAGDCFIQLLESFPCNTKEELLKREGELIRQYKNELVNIRIEGRTSKEYNDDNKEKHSEYYQTNKTLIREKANQKINCECGGIFSNSNKARHILSQKHIQFTQDFLRHQE
jgi:hypothetical protein